MTTSQTIRGKWGPKADTQRTSIVVPRSVRDNFQAHAADLGYTGEFLLRRLMADFCRNNDGAEFDPPEVAEAVIAPVNLSVRIERTALAEFKEVADKRCGSQSIAVRLIIAKILA